MTGFKSFVEPTDFEIRDGLTGIVGPNGCGKSNVLEALRWVMGATSAKALRGTSMDAVIFAGTSMRPQRNWCEVTLTLDNTTRTAPAEYNECETIDITRRIIRKDDGTQSIYKINAKEVRAKDVQLFFADASSGANSPALVRQGQVADLINSKPQNRRRILEEAAGITGLHTRRHEAELRLRAAETNLGRLDDVIGELENQKTALARQARQAVRYRNVSGDIRRTEAMAAYLRWQEAITATQETEKDLAGIITIVEQTTSLAAKALTERETAHEGVEPLRLREAEAAAALHRLNVARENLDEEAERAKAEIIRIDEEILRLKSDIEREGALLGDAEAAISNFQEEKNKIDAQTQIHEQKRNDAEEHNHQAKEFLEEQEKLFESASRENAEQDARRRALNAQITGAKEQITRIENQHNTLTQERTQIVPTSEESEKLSKTRSLFGKAEEAIKTAEIAQQRADEEHSKAEATELALRQPQRKAEQSLAEIKAERDALTKLLANHAGDWPALIEHIEVTPGFENALAAALGDDLNAAIDPHAPVHWSKLGRSTPDHSEKPLPLPNGARILSEAVKAPPELARRLSMIGIVTREVGDRLAAKLQPGQRLVSKDGDLWRWDGYVARAEARTAAAIRLEQRNRLHALENEIGTVKSSVDEARREHRHAAERIKESRQSVVASRQLYGAARRHFEETRSGLTKLEKHFEHASARTNAINETLARLKTENEEITARLTTLASDFNALPEVAGLLAAVNETRAKVVEARGKADEARQNFDNIVRETRIRDQRLEQITKELSTWSERASTARERIEGLNKRLATLNENHKIAKAAPGAIEEKRKSLLDKIGEAETLRNNEADALAKAQTQAAQKDKASRIAEEAASEARESRARLEAQSEASITRVEEATALARENCNAEPEALLGITEHKEGKDLPTRADTEKKLERYKRERENLGGVNLRADEELTEISTRLEDITTEREDCEGAIRKLRSAISNINREARQRLLDAFETVNQNFSRLFTTLFNGGHAELRLVDAEDPLEAGLEIYASPPGKKLTSMMLMSGGEQALTATSLIFAVFMANPAPVCVLDEVDAPLDDANTERFCRMLAEMAQEGKTRFVVITHHALTMSRMDRLFGVTMIERGVSQLVSVDLSNAEQLAAAE